MQRKSQKNALNKKGSESVRPSIPESQPSTIQPRPDPMPEPQWTNQDYVAPTLFNNDSSEQTLGESLLNDDELLELFGFFTQHRTANIAARVTSETTGKRNRATDSQEEASLHPARKKQKQFHTGPSVGLSQLRQFQPVQRRSRRESVIPKHLNDYVTSFKK